MKVKLYKYQINFRKIFEKEKERILNLVDGIEIYHIGSTVIKGMVGKGIIDMMVVPVDWESRLKIVENLRRIGYKHVHGEENGRIFLSNKVKTEERDFHIHMVEKESRDNKELIFFVKFLNKNEDVRKEYEEIKLKAGGLDREEYGRVKGEFVKNILKELDF